MSMLLYPPFLQWEVVSECNHKCIHCYNYWRADDIPVEECCKFNEITEKIIERKPLYLAITGGEPLLVFSKIRPCIEKFVEAGIICSISTNGTLLNENMVKFFKEKNIDLVISLPSADYKTCDQVCNAIDVVPRLVKKWELLKKYNIPTTINIVLTKLNLKSLPQSLKLVSDWGFVARVGIAQRPINASKEYMQYELDRNDFNWIVKECIKAKKKYSLDVDLSVCIPDCAFDNEDEYLALDKGDCFAGTIAYAICTNGDIKACQCDTKVYGNILTDSFQDVYVKMAEWRNGSMIPKECEQCNMKYSCKGGCRVEAYAHNNDYKSLPTFANLDNVPVKFHKKVKSTIFDANTIFEVSNKIKFVKDIDCYRLSVGIVPTFLPLKFTEWLMQHNRFTFIELMNESNADEQQVKTVLNMLINNKVIEIVSKN